MTFSLPTNPVWSLAMRRLNRGVTLIELIVVLGIHESEQSR